MAQPLSSTLCYHVALVSAHTKVQREGLVCNQPAGGFPVGVYLFASRDNAVFFAEHMNAADLDEYGSDEEGREIWQVQCAGLKLLPDPAVSSADEFQNEYPVLPLASFYNPSKIEPERLLYDGG